MFDPQSEIGRRYLDYIENRARIWAEKYLDGKEPDYRGDAVLQKYHFCNVWRELDRYSRWEIAEIRGRPLEEQIDIIVVGRMTMVPATVWKLLAGATADDIRQHAAERRAAGLPWYNSALQIRCPGGSDYAELFTRHRDAYVADRMAIFRAVRDASNAQLAALSLAGRLPHVGAFRAYEIATSLTYSEHLPHLRETDLFHVGPGAASGLEMLTGKRSTTHAAFKGLYEVVLHALKARRSFRWITSDAQGSPHYKERCKFTLRTLEDSMCEFRKYAVLHGAGGVVTRRSYRQRDVAA